MTYSIVARDPDTGELGVAVQSHWFSVGSIVTWARPGVGAVATQANVEVAYGPSALALLADGVPAPDALARLLAADPGGPSRQVAVVDAAGRVGVHTGPKLHRLRRAHHRRGRLLPGQHHGLRAGVAGHARGVQRRARAPRSRCVCSMPSMPPSARAAISAAASPPRSWSSRPRASRGARSSRCASRTIPSPCPSSAGWSRCTSAYRLAGQADELLNAGRHDEAARLYVQASERAPGNHELLFWAGLGTAAAGDLDARRGHGAQRDRASAGLARAAPATARGARAGGGRPCLAALGAKRGCCRPAARRLSRRRARATP